jgi:response regulator RpfG family c-di-GMP phosphodiesterase
MSAAPQPRLLVVDDEPNICRMVAAVLGRSGFAVETATGGEEALDRFRSEAFDLLLTDIKMPGMTGLELLQRCREIRPGVPAIVFTGYATTESAAAAVRSGADHYLRKPFEIGELRRVVTEVLGNAACPDEPPPGDTGEPTFPVLCRIADALDARHAFMAGHSRRVASTSAALARRLEMPDADVRRVWRAARIHDIGLVAVPSHLQEKPGRLTERERAQMATHPVHGSDLVQGTDLADTVGPGIRSHHERWDGSGYPDGLQRENIPATARLIAVAEAFDALTSERPYRAPFEAEAAVSELRGTDGTRCDPAVVDALAALARPAR